MTNKKQGYSAMPNQFNGKFMAIGYKPERKRLPWRFTVSLATGFIHGLK
jgi:hypothetical protein